VQRRLSKLIAALAVMLAQCAPTMGSIGAMLVQSHPDGKVTVRDAPPGLPAAQAGLVPGDQILFINGRDVRDMSPDAIHLALEGEVGSTVELTVAHRGQIERMLLKRAPLEPSKNK
jgi:carboxyl-terminal processing protease